MLGKLINRLKSLGGNTIYYPGCLTRFAGKHIEENYRKILGVLGIDFIMLPEFRCCGSPVISAGFREDFERLEKEHLDILRKYSVRRIITNCPSCYKMLAESFSGHGIEVEHMTRLLAHNLDKLPARSHYGERICYHDPCHLGRGSGIFDEPRKVLRMLGFDVIEMKNSGELSLCCGGGGGVRSNYKELSAKIAGIRIAQCNEKKLVTPCTLCYLHMKESSRDTGIEVFEFSEVIV